MVSVVIPALNEERNIRAAVLTVIRAAEAAGDAPIEIIVVNDGSVDRTGAISDRMAQEFAFVRVLHQPFNRGQGAAVRAALEIANHDQITMVPGDNELSFYTIRNLLLNRDKADYVLAMIINTEYRPARRILLSAIFSHVYTTTFGLPIKYINAPGLWPVAILRRLDLRARRYSLHGEINAKLLRQPITFLEIDGYMNPAIFKSSAVRLRNFAEAANAYLRLCFEVFVRNPKKYAAKATRVMPPGVFDNVSPAEVEQPAAREAHVGASPSTAD